MAEIKRKIKQLPEGRLYRAKAGDYLIMDNHTISDVRRWLIHSGIWEEILIQLKEHEKKTKRY